MTVLESVFLGLLQGLTEFLPVSSSGHLILAERLFAIEANLFFDIILHFGTLLAVIVVYRQTLWQAIRHPLKDKTALYVIIASIPTFIIAFVVEFFIPEQLLYNLLPLGFALTAVLLVLSDVLYRPSSTLQSTKIMSVVTTGIVQGLAVFPGLSRSGSTVSTMKLFGVKQSDCATFSFLLSIPVILAACAVKTYRYVKSPLNIDVICVLVGVVTAFLSGWVALKTVQRVLKKGKWSMFAVYLAIPFLLSLLTM